MLLRASSLAALSVLALTAVACGSTQGKDDEGTSAGAYSQYNPDGGAYADEAPGIELDEKGFPRTKSMNGYSFSGCEYWPYHVSSSPYPDHIVWGCNPGSSPEAEKCMGAAMRRLAVILKDPPEELKQLKEKYGISSFFNWNNDRFGVAEGEPGGSDRIWLYQGRLIKWISGTNRDGTCNLPEKSDLVNFANRCLQGDDTRPGC